MPNETTPSPEDIQAEVSKHKDSLGYIQKVRRQKSFVIYPEESSELKRIDSVGNARNPFMVAGADSPHASAILAISVIFGIIAIATPIGYCALAYYIPAAQDIFGVGFAAIVGVYLFLMLVFAYRIRKSRLDERVREQERLIHITNLKSDISQIRGEQRERWRILTEGKELQIDDHYFRAYLYVDYGAYIVFAFFIIGVVGVVLNLLMGLEFAPIDIVMIPLALFMTGGVAWGMWQYHQKTESTLANFLAQMRQQEFHLFQRCLEIGIKQALQERTSAKNKVPHLLLDLLNNLEQDSHRYSRDSMLDALINADSSKESQVRLKKAGLIDLLTNILYEKTVLSDLRRSNSWSELRNELTGVRRLASQATRSMEQYLRRGHPQTLSKAVTRWCNVINHKKIALESNEFQAMAYNEFGNVLLQRHLTTGNSADLQEAFKQWYHGLNFVQGGSPEFGFISHSLGNGFNTRYSRNGDLADLEQSISFFQQAIRSVPLASISRLSILTSLGSGLRERYARLGNLIDLEMAVTADQQALEMTTPTTKQRALILTNLGNDLHARYTSTRDLADLEKSIAAYRQATEITPSASPGRAVYLANWSKGLYARYLLLRQRSDLEQTIANHEQALQLTPANSTLRTSILAGLGNGLQARARLTREEDDSKRAVAAYREVCNLGLETNLESTLESSLAWGDWALERSAWDEAVQAFEFGMQAMDRLFRTQLLRAGKESWLRDAQSLPLHAAYASTRSGHPDSAVEILESGRTRLMAESLERNRADMEGLKTADRKDLYERYQQVTTRISQLESEELRGRNVATPTDSTRELRAAHKELDTVIDMIRQVPGYNDFHQSPNFQQIQQGLATSLLDSTTLALDIYLLTTHVGGLALLLYPGGVRSTWLDFTESLLDNLLLSDESGGYLHAQLDTERLQTVLDKVLPLLGEKVVQPITAELRSILPPSSTAKPDYSIVLIPTGRLALLPWQAVSHLQNGFKQAFLDEFAISYAPSIQALQHCQETLRRLPQSKYTLLGIGNPQPLPQNVPPLIYAQAELNDIALMFGPQKTLLYEQQATRSNIEPQLGKTTHLHLSCHGQFNSTDPLLSGVILSCGEMLTLADLLVRERLKGTRLAVLSACQTALIDVANLPEESIGLPAGFVQAGVPGVVGTLWPVNDLSTMLLMVKFYEAHLKEGLAPAAALRKAQLWLRDVTNAELSELFARYKLTATDRPTSTRMAYEMASEKFREHTLRDPNERPYAHPYYWAPFVFYGA